jgi:alkylation response protein AidB-like acyl-CoA dehydrogenase
MDWQDGVAFDLGEEVAMVRQTARAFAEEKVLPLAAKIDQLHYFPRELIPQMGELGFMGATVPTEYGGSGLSQVAYCLIIEELAAACASTSVFAGKAQRQVVALWVLFNHGRNTYIQYGAVFANRNSIARISTLANIHKHNYTSTST